MLILSEANVLISTQAEMTEEDFCLIEAKTELYKKIFAGFGNTEEESKEFYDKKKDFLESLSDSEREAYADNLLAKIEEYYDKAEAEYQERIHSIHALSKDGYEEGVPAFEESKMAESLGTQYPFTKFTKLTNLPINREYRCNDDGLYVYDSKALDYVRICDALSIKNLAFDDSTITQYIELEYYEYQNYKKSVRSVCMPSEELAKGSYSMLHKIGIVINSPRLLTAFLNDIRSIDYKTKKIRNISAQLKYGYPAKKDGTLDFSRFIGIGEENRIIPVMEYNRLDSNLFKKCGTVEGFTHFLSEVSKGKYQIDFQMIVAAALSSIVLAYVNNNLNLLAPPSYIFIGRTSIGKGILGAIANNIWCAPDSAGSICCSSDSSTAFMYALKNRLNIIPFIIPDIQDLLDRVGIQGVNDIIFTHSNGQAGGKATTSGEVRDNPKDWKNTLISFSESDWFSNNPHICGGADARYTILHLNIANEDRWLTEKAPIEYAALEKSIMEW